MNAGIPMVDHLKDRVTSPVAELDGEAGGETTGELWAAVYDELRRLASWKMGADGRRNTLQPTALVHEAYLRLVDQPRSKWRSRTHFVAVASKVMRNLLIDHARKKASGKRGGDRRRVTLAEGVSPFRGVDVDLDQLLTLNAALDRLADHDPKQARVVELRFFGGLKVDEVAEVMGLSKRSVEGYWTHARAWLLRELSREGGR